MSVMGILSISMAWLFLSVVAGIIASKKGRCGFGYFLLSAIFSPVIGLPWALVVKDSPYKIAQHEIEIPDSRDN